jgi:predicted nucleic acid-binding protein
MATQEQLLLDTDVLIEYLRGSEQASEYLEDQKGPLLISTITVAELYAGARDESERDGLDQFILAFDLLPVTSEIAKLGGQYRQKFKPSHNTGLADALIAATAILHSATLVTFNAKHFPMLHRQTIPYVRT